MELLSQHKNTSNKIITCNFNFEVPKERRVKMMAIFISYAYVNYAKRHTSTQSSDGKLFVSYYFGISWKSENILFIRLKFEFVVFTLSKKLCV